MTSTSSFLSQSSDFCLEVADFLSRGLLLFFGLFPIEFVRILKFKEIIGRDVEGLEHGASPNLGAFAELSFERLCFVFQLDYHGFHFLHGRQVDGGHFGLDRLQLVREFERILTFVEVVELAAAGAQQGGLGVAAQGFLEQEGELGVSERDVSVLVHDGIDHSPERRQAFTDVLSLLQLLALGARLVRSFSASQINEVDFGRLDAPIFLDFFQVDHEDGVAPRPSLVQVGCRVLDLLLPLLNQFENLVWAGDDDRLYVRNTRVDNL